MEHYHLEDESMHPLEFLVINIIFVALGNIFICLPPLYLDVNSFDIWEVLHRAGYFVPFIGLFINQRKAIFGWFKKKRR